MVAEKRKYTAAELVDMIRTKYSGNGAYTVLEQVAAGTGAGANSWIDAAVFSLWPSKGVWRAACEVKVSRADWLKELSDPSKNEWARQHFDFFWYVVAPGVAKDDETPAGCGLMVARGNGLSILKHAPRREGVVTDEYIVASFARSLEKEKSRFVERELRDAVRNDREYASALFYKSAVKKYLKLCGEYCFPDTEDELVAKLQQVAASPEQKRDIQDAKHAIDLLNKFQTDVTSFVLAIAPLCGDILTARDGLGEFIVKRWGIDDNDKLETLRRVRKGQARKSRANATVKQLQSRDEVAKWLQDAS